MVRCDPISHTDGRGEIRPPIGLPADELKVPEPYQPSALSLANEFSRLLADGARFSHLIPIPAGMSFITDADNPHLELRLNSTMARRIRRAFGRIGEIQLAKEALGAVCRGPSTLSISLLGHPLFFGLSCLCLIPMRYLRVLFFLRRAPHATHTQLQSICMPPLRFGGLPAHRGGGDIFIYVGVGAYASRAAFPPLLPACGSVIRWLAFSRFPVDRRLRLGFLNSGRNLHLHLHLKDEIPSISDGASLICAPGLPPRIIPGPSPPGILTMMRRISPPAVGGRLHLSPTPRQLRDFRPQPCDFGGARSWWFATRRFGCSSSAIGHPQALSVLPDVIVPVAILLVLNLGAARSPLVLLRAPRFPSGGTESALRKKIEYRRSQGR